MMVASRVGQPTANAIEIAANESATATAYPTTKENGTEGIPSDFRNPSIGVLWSRIH